MFLIRKLNHKGQTWSIDAMISMMVFITAVVVLLYFLLFSSGKKTIEDLKSESELIPLKITANKDGSNPLAFIINGKIDKEKLKALANIDYSTLKSQFGVNNEFCIFFEDSSGNLINISATLEKSDIMGIGNSEFKISGYSCG